jgi:hypothetical protein
MLQSSDGINIRNGDRVVKRKAGIFLNKGYQAPPLPTQPLMNLGLSQNHEQVWWYRCPYLGGGSRGRLGHIFSSSGLAKNGHESLAGAAFPEVRQNAG